MSNFREDLEEDNLHDLGWRGGKFTWSNKHGGQSFTKEKLDRTIANPQWFEMYKEFLVEGLAARSSYYKPIILLFSKLSQRSGYNKKRHSSMKQVGLLKRMC